MKKKKEARRPKNVSCDCKSYNWKVSDSDYVEREKKVWDVKTKSFLIFYPKPTIYYVERAGTA